MKELIKKILKEDFDWIQDIETNPFQYYDGIIFDVVPSEETVRKYIDLALNSGKNIQNVYGWDDEDDIKSDIETIIDYAKEDGSFLRINNNNLTFGRGLPGYDYDETKFIKLSQLMDVNKLNESDGFEWVRDTTTNPFLIYPNVVVFINNKKVTEEQLGLLYDLAVESGVEYNETSRKDFINNLLGYSKKSLTAYMKVYTATQSYNEPRRLGYGSSKGLFDEYKNDLIRGVAEYKEYNLSDIM